MLKLCLAILAIAAVTSPAVFAAKSAATRPTLNLTIQGRPSHPTIYLDREDIARAKLNRQTPWGKTAADNLLKSADTWAAKSDDDLRKLIPQPGACFAYGFSSCPLCSGVNSWWGKTGCTLDDPGHVRCPNGHRMPDAEHPDSGAGWRDPTGKIYYFVGTYNAFVSEQLLIALDQLTHAYALSGDDKYGAKAALILDELARVYPTCDKGSWDYPSNPPSGRFNRPWYQVARTLISYANHYDILMNGDLLNAPSSVPGLSKRQNIEQNLLLNGAKYCYDRSLEHPALNNGQADYMRGCMVVGVALGIPQYVAHAVHGPTGLLSMIENNVDRDGQYYETSALYAHHTRYLYMDMVEILHNYKDDAHSDGIRLIDNPRFRAFYLMPQSRITVAGHLATLGDDAPDLNVVEKYPPISKADVGYLHHLLALAHTDQDRNTFAALLASANQKSPETDDTWLLFHAPSNVKSPTSNPQNANGPTDRCDLLTQKGFAVMRSGNRGFTLRFGPTLNHGHFDELNLNLYGLGRQLNYDLGYGLGSTHTQVGWAKQTASHTTVLVDETPQLKSSGSGGTLALFADLPGLKLVEADAPLAYASQNVTRYDRTVAMIDSSPDSGYFLDIFRIAGGKKHDYIFHAPTTRLAVDDAQLSEPQPGSVAGATIDYGSRIGPDGDVLGFANKPYWNPPPQNGLGFLIHPRRANAEGPITATWTLDDNAHLRLHLLPMANTQIVTAEANGILPKEPRAAYLFVRRASVTSGSTFASICEASAASPSIKQIRSLLPEPLSDENPPVAVEITLNSGRRDYIVHQPPGASKPLASADPHFTLAGEFAKWSTDEQGGLIDATLLAGTSLQLPNLKLTVPQTHFTGRITRIDYDRAILYTDADLPPGKFPNQFITLSNPAYSRGTTYRIVEIGPRQDNLTPIHLGDTTLAIGRGHMDDPPKGNTLPNLVPLEYAKCLSHQSTGFYRGKLLTTPDRQRTTTIADIDGASGTTITVSDAAPFRAADDLVIWDLQPGDTFDIPTVVHLSRDKAGALIYHGNTPATLTENDRTTDLRPQ